ncbi:cupin [Sphingomonas xinjiangensis]|uniref:Mannose-6-phosphate isomerase-like protein (Cupin superfamily) n=1 Tax=Sphingomonas xinjiangensis TaxID=643568 RepID=A0A840YP24_9SPHN|nr:cupin [Sphingomonas xinjiangensis]MBB5709053.1 mannose-6-phosphate isomerase-like protein (cupin superfamily) [Sphingomonas xinjiangensis]
MPEIIQDARTFRANRPWGARDLVEIEGATARLHWTDQPYQWHINDGAELFCVVDGAVDMHYRQDDGEHVVRLDAGDMFVAGIGDEHVAHPLGEARILVFERKGSV